MENIVNEMLICRVTLYKYKVLMEISDNSLAVSRQFESKRRELFLLHLRQDYLNRRAVSITKRRLY